MPDDEFVAQIKAVISELPTYGAKVMSLSAAREARDRFRISLLDGTAPGAHTSHGKTFGDALQAYLDTRAPAWKGGSEGAEADAHRRLFDLDLAKLPLSQIGTDTVRAALKPWDGTPTSTKIRTKLASILDFAKAHGWFTGDNPAAAKTMGKILPATGKTKPREAMPWGELPAFMAHLATFDTPASRALRWTILNAARAGETRFATWSEIQGNTWSIAGERMKEGASHVVPLSDAALALLGPRGEPGELIFKSPTGIALHDTAMRAYLKGRGYSVHGFRSTFTDWAAEHDYPSELREIAIAHAVGDQVERAYRRSNMVDKRRPMMQAYAAFATSKDLRAAASQARTDN